MAQQELQSHKYTDEWKLADKDGSGKLNFKEVERLLNKLNLGLKDSDLKARFKKIDTDGNKELDFHEFCVFLDELHVRPEFKSIFEQYTKGKNFMTPEAFLAFLQDQGEKEATVETAKKLMTKHEANLDQFSFQSFTSYMTSAENALYNHEHTSRVYQPMNLPLSHYLIASSHNTYAEAHQLVGVASAEAYITALKKGCKCLELDVWDGDDNMPIITHGHTLLTKLKFRDAIVAIRDYSFVVSPYPVILSFENHCSERQQIRMAEILIEVLGGAGMLPNHLFDKVFPLPTPDQLKNKVLVKGKVITPFVAGEIINTQKKTKKPAIVIAKELSDLVHLKATHFNGFPHDHKNKAFEMFSISEQKVESFFAKEFNNLVKLTATQCAKVYPKGTRFGSSNYSPVVGWSTGCQMVCLNYQTSDEPMWLNHGRFLDNGGVGYVLKPQTLLAEKPDLSKKTLTLTLLSGWSLPKETGTQTGSIINPYVNIKTFGVPEDTKKFKSKIVHLDGFNPSWNDTFTMDLHRPELAMILFKVYEHDTKGKNDFLGYSAIPISSLKTGYRNVVLYDAKGVKYPEASLFVKVALA